MKKVKAKNICKQRNYHVWSDGIDSTTENYEEMSVSTTCEDCGATFEASGDWIIIEDDVEDD